MISLCKKNKKKILSVLAFLSILSFFISSIPEVHAKSNLPDFKKVSYKTGTYISLEELNIYSNNSGTKRTGKKIPNNKSFHVSSVKGEYGKTTYKGKAGWVNLSYAYNSLNTVNIKERLNMLRKKFPAGKYWNKVSANKNNPDGWTNKPCANGHKDKRCAYFDGTCQCHGFAIKLGYDLFGIHPYNWERHYDISKVKAGDLIRYRGHHTVMVTGVYNTYFTVADCNWLYHCGIEWDRRMEKKYFSFYKGNKHDGVYHCPTNGGYIYKKTITTTTVKTSPTSPSSPTSSDDNSTSSGNTVTLASELSVSKNCSIILVKSQNKMYFATGKTKNGKTTFSITAPKGTYPELVIIADGCEEYVINNFNLGKDKLPAKIKLKKV